MNPRGPAKNDLYPSGRPPAQATAGQMQPAHFPLRRTRRLATRSPPARVSAAVARTRLQSSWPRPQLVHRARVADWQLRCAGRQKHREHAGRRAQETKRSPRAPTRRACQSHTGINRWPSRHVRVDARIPCRPKEKRQKARHCGSGRPDSRKIRTPGKSLAPCFGDTYRQAPAARARDRRRPQPPTLRSGAEARRGITEAKAEATLHTPPHGRKELSSTRLASIELQFRTLSLVPLIWATQVILNAGMLAAKVVPFVSNTV